MVFAERRGEVITMKQASELEVGDVFSTDGYTVDSVYWVDGKRSVTVTKGGHLKHALLEADERCPIWTADDRETRAHAAAVADDIGRDSARLERGDGAL